MVMLFARMRRLSRIAPTVVQAIAAFAAACCISCATALNEGKELRLPNPTDIAALDVAIGQRDGLELPTGTYTIAKDDWPDALEFLQPKKKYIDRIEGDIYPTICTVTITDKSGAESHFMVKWMGKNPLLISLDGQTWYWATEAPKVADTALGFVSFVKDRGKKRLEEKKIP